MANRSGVNSVTSEREMATSSVMDVPPREPATSAMNLCVMCVYNVKGSKENSYAAVWNSVVLKMTMPAPESTA